MFQKHIIPSNTNHPSPFVAAYFYQQAPMRAIEKDTDDVVKADIKEGNETKAIIVDKSDEWGLQHA